MSSVGGADGEGIVEDICVCRNCGPRMELRAVVIRPPATIKVLDGLLGSMCGRDPPNMRLE